MTVTALTPARNLNLVAPLPHEGTAMRTTDTAASVQARSGAVAELIGPPVLRPDDVDRATVAPTPGTRTLNNGGPARRCPTLRVSIDDGLGAVLMRWDLDNGWRQTATGDPV